MANYTEADVARYLQHAMSPTEKAAFELALAQDPALKQLLAAAEAKKMAAYVQVAIELHQPQGVRAQIEAAGKRYQRRMWLMIAIGGLFLVVGGGFGLKKIFEPPVPTSFCACAAEAGTEDLTLLRQQLTEGHALALDDGQLIADAIDSLLAGKPAVALRVLPVSSTLPAYRAQLGWVRLRSQLSACQTDAKSLKNSILAWQQEFPGMYQKQISKILKCLENHE